MPVVVVGTEKNLTQLRSRLVEGRMSKAANERLVEAIEKANPGVDLARLQPGIVLTIPRLDNVKLRPKIDVLANKATNTHQVMTEVERAIAGIDEVANEQAKRRQAARVATGRTLRLKGLEAQTKRNPQLRANIKAATETLAAQERSDKEAAQQLKKVVSAWSDDLAKLRDLGLGD